MTNERNNMNDTTVAVPPAPNGHGATGTTTGETRQAATATDGSTKVAPSSSKKKKKKKRHQHHNTPASTPVEAAAAAATDQRAPTGPSEPTEPTGPTEPIDPQPPIGEAIAAAPIEAIAAALIEAIAAAPIEAPATAPIEPPTAAPFAAPAAPIAAPVDNLRLRMKIWTDRATSKRYLMPSAFMRDVVNGQPVSDVMYAYAMRDDSTKIITLTAAEWNALPFFYFQEEGPAPRAATRPLDDKPVFYAKTT